MNSQYNIILHSYALLINAVYHDNNDEGIQYILGFSWHILFADVAVINITFQVIFTYDIFFSNSQILERNGC